VSIIFIGMNAWRLNFL